jgi:hypothetical protein
MENKTKNPLYVVSGKEVEEASGLIDFILKKFNLEPAINFFNMIIEMLLEQINSYPMLVAAREFIDLILKRVELFRSLSIL